MKEKIEVDLKDVRRLFLLLENMNCFFHQPMNFENPKRVQEFALKNYPELHKLYYNVVWEWLPKEIQKEIENGEDVD